MERVAAEREKAHSLLSAFAHRMPLLQCRTEQAKVHCESSPEALVVGRLRGIFFEERIAIQWDAAGT